MFWNKSLHLGPTLGSQCLASGLGFEVFGTIVRTLDVDFRTLDSDLRTLDPDLYNLDPDLRTLV